MSWKSMLLGACLAGLQIGAAAAVPTAAEIMQKIRPEHPRLFLTPAEMPTFGERIRKSPMFPEIKEFVATLPENPKLELREDVAKWDGDKVVFIKKIGDQNALNAAVIYCGGNEAVCCTLMYFATGEERYRQMALKYLKLNLEFSALSERSKVLPGWYNAGRLCAIIAWDWLYNTMTPQERHDLMAPLVRHIEFMRNPGYLSNNSGPESGFYGEAPLRWYIGVALHGEKIEEELSRKMLVDGYNLACQMMSFRDKCSGGSGVLSTITTGYSMAFYPYASFHFLMTLQSACDLDMTKHWIHMRDFDNFASWMMIPDALRKTGFVDFGWGDASKEYGLTLWFTYMLYNHMAQQIHLYGESADARTLISMLPEQNRKFDQRKYYPFIAFVVPRFSPEVSAEDIPKKAPVAATQFPTYGLTVMRSGTTTEDTYASFKGGAWYSNHQHYDENSFIIYKKGFQAVDSGTRGAGSVHHLLYYPQTVAHNAILIRGFQEPVAEYWYPRNAPPIPEGVYMDGGQNKSAMATALPFVVTEQYAICGGDATACYAKEKCKEAVRQFVYIRPDYFVVYDRVESVKADQDKVFLLHTIGEPVQKDGVWHSGHGEGALFARMLLPKDHQTEVIGGPGKEYMANGVNYPSPMPERPTSVCGKYRIEFKAPAKTDARFLTVLQAADQKETAMVDCKLSQSEEFDTVSFTTREGLECTVSFRRTGKVGGILEIKGGKEPVRKEF